MKCKNCGKTFTTNDKSTKYCEECYQTEYVDSVNLTNYLHEVIDSDVYDGKFTYIYVKNIREKYNCTNFGMKATFEFMYTVLGKRNRRLFPKYEEFYKLYNEVKKFYGKLFDICDTLENTTNIYTEPSYLINDDGELVVTFSKIKYEGVDNYEE